MKRISLLSIAVLVAGCVYAQKSINVPASVKSVFEQKFPKATAVKWSKENATEYEAEFKIGGTEQSANFSEYGSWLVTETEIKKADLPSNVLSSITKTFPGYKLEEIEKVEKPGVSVYYEAQVEKGKETYKLELSADGKILKKEKEVEKEKD